MKNIHRNIARPLPGSSLIEKDFVRIESDLSSPRSPLFLALKFLLLALWLQYSFPEAKAQYNLYVARVADEVLVDTYGNETQVYVYGSAGVYSEGVGYQNYGLTVFYNQWLPNGSEGPAVTQGQAFIAWAKQFQYISSATPDRRPSWAKPSSSYEYNGNWVGFDNLDRLWLREKGRRDLATLVKAYKGASSAAAKKKLKKKIKKLKRKIRRL